mmetsp:Transcript_30406/g.48591  ORF Transcript_30406/g.48591 Transcript_30406/m.48591 type:complete len:362 (-) Transcript_30406:2627-3712(-)
MSELEPRPCLQDVKLGHVDGRPDLTHDMNEEEVFRRVWKYYKRNKAAVAEYVQEGMAGPDACGKRKRRERVSFIDFDNLGNSPAELAALVHKMDVCNGDGGESEDVHVKQAFTVEGRPGFVFIPNPFKSVERESYWFTRLALAYARGDVSERNHTQDGEACALDPKLRWATLGFHYDWKNRRYSEEKQSPFPDELGVLAKQLAKSVGESIEPETAIVNYYKHGTTMGGHKDDAEWTDEAPVVSISFGNAGIYVLGGESHSDPGPPAPIPLLIRSGDVVILGGESRMNVHGVPCLLKNTFPQSLETSLRNNHENFLGIDQQSTTHTAASVTNYLKTLRVNVNVRQVRTNKMILEMLKRRLVK